MGGYRGTPVVLELLTGKEWAVGPLNYYMNAPSWAPDGARLAFICQSGVLQEPQPDGTVREMRINCPADGLIVVSGDGSLLGVPLPFRTEAGVYYSNPSWSPDGTKISVFTNSSEAGSCRGYSLVEVASGTVGPCLPLPSPGGAGGRCGGDSEDGSSDWSPDGTRLAYHTMFGAGQNGAFIVDPVSRHQTLVRGNAVSHISFSPDGRNITFANASHVWVADIDGSGIAVLAEGTRPVWQPR